MADHPRVRKPRTVRREIPSSWPRLFAPTIIEETVYDTVVQTDTLVIHLAHQPAVTLTFANPGELKAWQEYIAFHAGRRPTTGVRPRRWTSSLEAPAVHVSMWDFAGQVEYYDAHPLFLSARAVILVLWSLAADVADDRERAASSERKAFWLRSLHRHVLATDAMHADADATPVVFLVGTHADDRRVDASAEARAQRERDALELAARLTSLRERELRYHEVSTVSVRHDGFVRFREEVVAALSAWPRQKVPEAYLQVLDVVKALRARNPPFLVVSELLTECSQAGLRDLDPKTLRSALALLDAWGECVYYGERAERFDGVDVGSPRRWQHRLSDVVVTKPEWLTVEVFAALVEHLRKRQTAFLPEDDVAMVWPKWSPELRNTSMRLFAQFGLAEYVAPPHVMERHWFVPGALPSAPPDNVPAWLEPPLEPQRDIVRELVWTTLPRRFMSRLFLRVQADGRFGPAWAWSTGIFAGHGAGTAVRVEVHPDEQPRMRVWARGTAPGDAIAAVLPILAALGAEQLPQAQFEQVGVSTVCATKPAADAAAFFQQDSTQCPCRYPSLADSRPGRTYACRHVFPAKFNLVDDMEAGCAPAHPPGGPAPAPEPDPRDPPIDSTPGLVTLLRPDAGTETVDIVFVHSPYASSDATWRSADATFVWPKTWLAKTLPTAKVYVYNYAATAASPALDDAVNTLVASLRTKNLGKERPLVLVAHGLGGLLVKQAVATACADEQTSSGQWYAIFFGTPEGAVTTRDWCGLVPVQKTEELEPVIVTWCAASVSAAKAFSQTNVSSLSFVESLATNGRVLVPRMREATNVVRAEGADHHGISRPANVDSSVYCAFVGFIAALAPVAR